MLAIMMLTKVANVLFLLLLASTAIAETAVDTPPAITTGGIQDWLGPSDTCEIHGCKMEEVVVFEDRRIVCHTKSFGNAKPKQFPHHGPHHPSEFNGNSQGKIYVCGECDDAYLVFTGQKDGTKK
jgi:hypothetical protein